MTPQKDPDHWPQGFKPTIRDDRLEHQIRVIKHKHNLAISCSCMAYTANEPGRKNRYKPIYVLQSGDDPVQKYKEKHLDRLELGDEEDEVTD